MENGYVPAEKAYHKLRFARGMNTTVYLYGATGYGKTMLVREYLGRSEALWLSVGDAQWDLSALEAPAKVPTYVVIDDLHLLDDEGRRSLILDLARREDIWLVLIGRMPTPHWLRSLIVDCLLAVIPEEALHLSEKEIRKIAAAQEVPLTDEEISYLAQTCQGNGYAISTALQYIKFGHPLDAALTQYVDGFFEEYLENQIISQWSIALQEFLMMVSVVDSFTVPMAETITGDDQSAAMIDQAMQTGNFLTQKDGEYFLRPQLLSALRSRAKKVIGTNKVRQCADRAGLFFEMHDDVMNALKMYEFSENTDNIRNLLIRNGRRHPVFGYHYTLRRYYMTLSPEDVGTSAVLMSTMSILYSILMNPEESEYWYDRLRSYAQSVSGGEKAEANARLLWLDIILPHRGSRDLLEVIKRIISITRSGVKLPEISVTSSMPSTMNGGKDFCHWSKHDRVLADSIGKPLEKLLGSFGKGLVNLALGESFYEKGCKDYDVLSHLTRGQMEAEGSGENELVFAAVGLQCRLSMIRGNVTNAEVLLDGFEKRAIQQKAFLLLPNVHALRCRIALMCNNRDAIDAWMEEAPNESVEFCSMERFRYMAKVRVYLAQNELDRAYVLLERLRCYAEFCNRPYIRMESGLLMAVTKARQGAEWEACLLSALQEVQEYQFVRLISEEGAAIAPLLKKIRSTYLASAQADEAWFDRVLKETEYMAGRYPAYLGTQQVDRSDFSSTALEVLRMQASGKNARQIAQELSITERTVKYHSIENYRKLGVKNKTAAIERARNLNLI